MDEYDKAAEAAASIKTNVVTLRENPGEIEAPQMIPEVQEAGKEDNETCSLRDRRCNAREEVAAFFEDLKKEELEAAAAAPRLTAATARVKARRPAITEFTVPSRWDIENSGPRPCIICLEPNLAMSVLRTHVQFKHRVSIGDPISKWIQAAKVWDDKHPDPGSDSKVTTPTEDKANCEITSSKPSVPAPRAKSNNFLNSETENKSLNNELIITKTSTMGVGEPNKDTLRQFEDKIASTQSKLEARCAANESKMQANFDANNSKIAELTNLQSATALSQSHFETRCASAQSKLQADIDKLNKLVEVNSSSRPQAEVIESLQGDIVKLTKLVEECSTNNSTILEITKVQHKNIDSSALNTAGLLEMKDSMVILTSRLDELSEQVKTNLGSKTHIAATNRKQTESDLSVTKCSESTIETMGTTNGRQTGFSPLITNTPGAVKNNQLSLIELYNTTSDNPVELANQTIIYKPTNKAESKLEISAMQPDKLHLETQLQSRSSPGVQSPTESSFNSVLNSREGSPTQTRETQLSNQSYILSTQSIPDITFLGHSLIMDHYTPPTRDSKKKKQLKNKSGDTLQTWRHNNRFGVLAVDSDDYSNSEEEGPGSPPPATPPPATSNPATTPPATPNPATTGPATAHPVSTTPIPPPTNPAASNKAEEEMARFLKKQAEEELAKHLEKQEEVTRALKKIEEEVSRSLIEQEELARTIKRIEEKTSKSHKEIGEVNKTLGEVKEMVAVSLKQANQADNTDSATHSEEEDPLDSSHRTCPLCHEPVRTPAAAKQHIKDHHTLPVPQPPSPINDTPDPVEVEEHVCEVSGKVTFDCIPDCKPGKHYGNTMKLKDIKARNEAMQYKWEPHICGSPITLTAPEHMGVTVRVSLTPLDTPSPPSLEPINTSTGKNTRAKEARKIQQQNQKRPEETRTRKEQITGIIGEVIETWYEALACISPVKLVIMTLLLVMNGVYGLPLITSPFLTAATHPFAWIPSNITGPELAALTRNITTETDSPGIDTPVTTPPGTNGRIRIPPFVRTLLLATLFVTMVGGTAILVIIRRRVKLEEQEEEEHPQNNDEDKEGGIFYVLDKVTNWRAQLKLPSWSKEHDMIQL